MPSLVEWILGGLAWVFSSAVGRFMAATGLAFITFTFGIEPWVDEIASKFAGLPGFATQMMAYFGVDKAITMIASAWGIKFAGSRISGVTRKTGAAVGGDL